jgi:broad specificity phosphatase PhoE
MKYLLQILFALLTANTCCAQSETAPGKHSRIYIVRHGEKQKGDDPLLTEEGYKRAGDLMRTLQHKGIKRVYITQYKRTQQTSDSIRLQLGIDTVQIIADTSCAALFTAISDHNDWNQPILIVTHSNIIQKIIYKLGYTDFPQQNIPEKEFDNLYMIKIQKKKTVLEHRKYGTPSAASATMKQ